VRRVEDRWHDDDAYEGYVGRWSRPVAERFIDWLDVPAGGRWLDVGCGTGALTATVLARAAPAAVIGVDPSKEFIAAAGRRVDDPRARFGIGTAGSVPIEDGWADAVVSGLVLNFVEDLQVALGEMRRAATGGATIAAYVWDYAGEMQLIRRFWDAAVALDPNASSLDEGSRFPLCAPGPLRDVFEAGGLTGIDVRSIDIPMVFRDFDDLWTPFLTGVGPAPGYTLALDEGSRTRLRGRLRATLPIGPDGSIHLVARALAVRGTTARPA
jgi:SAM-dependent methyltransferase